MKLGELRGAIRKMKGNPIIFIPIDGQLMCVTTQKTPLLEELERLFPGGKGAETSIEFSESTGVISFTIASGPGFLVGTGHSNPIIDDGRPFAGGDEPNVEEYAVIRDAAEPEQIDLEDAIAEARNGLAVDDDDDLLV